MLLAESAVLVHLQPVRIILLVFHSVVIALFALCAGPVSYTHLRGEMKDSYNLYKWAFTNLESKKILSKETAVDEVKLNYAWNKDTLLVMPKEDYSTILPQDISASSVIIKTDLPESIDAPVKKGDILGTATLSYAGQDLTTVDLVASESVERSELLHTTDTLKSILSSPWFLAIAIIIVLLVIIYIILAQQQAVGMFEVAGNRFPGCHPAYAFLFGIAEMLADV